MQESITERKSALRDIPFMGVIWVVDEAMKLGFYNGHPDWSNLGQGQPEVGEINGAPPRITNFSIEPSDQAYGPINGMSQLREAIANHYNRLYRKDKTSKFTAENVSVAMGGRLELSRIFASMGKVRLGYKIPDYTAYEDMINYQEGRVNPILIPTREENGFVTPGEQFGEIISENQLDAYLLSNPCNPTGTVIRGTELESYVDAARNNHCMLVADEFYSHFIYDGNEPGKGPVSTMEFVENVNHDPVIAVDGLTKSYRYPGWRIGWAIGPKDLIETLGRAGSAIDGGPSQPMQRAALRVLDPNYADQETAALRNVFSRKRNIMLKSLREMGILCTVEPESTFYIWADISQLPKPINNADDFFFAALEKKVMTVPGHYFDVNPGKIRRDSQFNQCVRFSFGPPEDNMVMGLERLEKLIKSY